METRIARQSRSRGQRLGAVLHKYVAVLQVSVASNLAYMAEVLFRALFLVVLIFVLGQLWKVTFAARGARLLSGFSVNDMIWYLAATRPHK